MTGRLTKHAPYKFLSLCLKKAGLNTNVIHFFNSYHSNCSTSYSWNTFTSPSFNVNVGVGQGSTLSPILSALYLALIIKMFKKRIKNLNKEILTDILSFVDDRLLISQEKSYSLYYKWSLTICDGCFDTLKSSKMQS